MTVSALFFLNKRYINIFYLYIGLVVTIPSNENLKQMLFLKWGAIDTSFVIILLMFTIFLLNVKSFKLLELDYLMIVIFILIIVFFIVGFNSKNVFLITDFKFYISMFVLYFFGRMVITNETKMKKSLQIMVISSLIYSLVVILLYFSGERVLSVLYGDTLANWWGSRVTFSNTSMLLVSTCIAIYLLIKTKYKFFYSTVLSINTVAIILSQSKTIITFYGVLIILILLMNFLIVVTKGYLSIKNLKYTYIFISLLVFFCILSVTTNFLGDFNLLNNVVNRYTSGNDSLNVRLITNDKALQLINSNFFGFGLGKEMYLYNLKGLIELKGLFIDNFYLTVATKFGVIGVTIFIILIISPIILLIKSTYKFKSLLSIYLLVSYILFLLTSTYMSSQLIYAEPVSAVFVLFLLFVCLDKPQFKAQR